jgi:hypothetical protein
LKLAFVLKGRGFSRAVMLLEPVATLVAEVAAPNEWLFPKAARHVGGVYEIEFSNFGRFP